MGGQYAAISAIFFFKFVQVPMALTGGGGGGITEKYLVVYCKDLSEYMVLELT